MQNQSSVLPNIADLARNNFFIKQLSNNHDKPVSLKMDHHNIYFVRGSLPLQRLKLRCQSQMNLLEPIEQLCFSKYECRNTMPESTLRPSTIMGNNKSTLMEPVTQRTVQRRTSSVVRQAFVLTIRQQMLDNPPEVQLQSCRGSKVRGVLIKALKKPSSICKPQIDTDGRLEFRENTSFKPVQSQVPAQYTQKHGQFKKSRLYKPYTNIILSKEVLVPLKILIPRDVNDSDDQILSLRIK